MFAGIRVRTTGRRARRNPARIALQPPTLLVPLAILCGVIAGCGGGGGSAAIAIAGSSGGGSSTASLVLAPTSVKVSSTTADSAPSTTVRATIKTSTSGASYYVSGSTTYNGIATASDNAAGSAVDFNLTFKSPASVGVGTYKDTLTVKACYQKSCAQQLSDSPQEIPITYTVLKPGPQLASLQPGQAYAGDSGFTLQVSGSGFTSGSVIEWNGNPMPTTHLSANALTTQIPSADIAVPGTFPITVSDQLSDTADSSPINFTVLAQSLLSISPTSATADAAGFTLTADGEFFTRNSVVYWNSTALPTTFVSSTELTAQVSGADVASPGTYAVRVAASQGSSYGSSTLFFTVQPLAALSLVSVSPTTVHAGNPAFFLTVLGQGFTGSSVVQWNGSARTTTYVSTAELLARIFASDVATTGTATVAVQNPSAQGGASGTATVSILPPPKDAVAFQINPEHSGAISFNSVTLPTASTWSRDVGGSPSYALITDGKVFLTVDTTPSASVSTSSELLALDQATGATDWGPISLSGLANAAYDNGIIFVTVFPSNGAPQVRAYDAATGDLKWDVSLGGSEVAAPTAADGLVYTTGVALLEGTGAISWKGAIGEGSGTTAVTADGVYAAYPCWAFDLRPATGETIWQNTSGCDGGGGETSVVANGVFYAPTSSGESGDELDAETGASLGSYTADYPPAIGGGTGYFLYGGTLNAIDLGTNTIIWTFTGDGQLATSPVIVNQVVFIGSASGNLYALDSATGQVKWQVNLGAPIPDGESALSSYFLSGLSAGDGLLVVPAGTKVTAYTLSTSP